MTQSLGIQEAMQGLQAAAVAAAPARPKPAPRKRKMYEIEVSPNLNEVGNGS